MHLTAACFCTAGIAVVATASAFVAPPAAAQKVFAAACHRKPGWRLRCKDDEYDRRAKAAAASDAQEAAARAWQEDGEMLMKLPPAALAALTMPRLVRDVTDLESGGDRSSGGSARGYAWLYRDRPREGFGSQQGERQEGGGGGSGDARSQQLDDLLRLMKATAHPGLYGPAAELHVLWPLVAAVRWRPDHGDGSDGVGQASDCLLGWWDCAISGAVGHCLTAAAAEGIGEEFGKAVESGGIGKGTGEVMGEAFAPGGIREGDGTARGGGQGADRGQRGGDEDGGAASEAAAVAAWRGVWGFWSLESAMAIARSGRPCKRVSAVGGL